MEGQVPGSPPNCTCTWSSHPMAASPASWWLTTWCGSPPAPPHLSRAAQPSPCPAQDPPVNIPKPLWGRAPPSRALTAPSCVPDWAFRPPSQPGSNARERPVTASPHAGPCPASCACQRGFREVSIAAQALFGQGAPPPGAMAASALRPAPIHTGHGLHDRPVLLLPSVQSAFPPQDAQPVRDATQSFSLPAPLCASADSGGAGLTPAAAFEGRSASPLHGRDGATALPRRDSSDPPHASATFAPAPCCVTLRPTLLAVPPAPCSVTTDDPRPASPPDVTLEAPSWGHLRSAARLAPGAQAVPAHPLHSVQF